MRNKSRLRLTLLCAFTFFTLQNFAQMESNGITVRLNHKLLDFTKIDNEQLVTGKIEDFLNPEGLNYLKIGKYELLNNLSFTKIFTTLKTADSISISRSGEAVSIPPFWATFNVRIPANSVITYKKLVGALKALYPLVIYAHPNYSCEFLSTPNDSLYSSQQSLSSSTYPLGHINVDSAWNIETGKRFIKVGVFDSGIDTTHQDLKSQVLTGRGYNLEPDTDSTRWGIDVRPIHGHGTLVAGIIGAKRNNDTGVAGIAGGDGSDTTGVSLIDFRLSPGFNGENISKAIIDAARSVGTYYDWSGQQETPNTEYYWSHASGYGIHLGNHSYKILVANISEIDTLGSGGKNESDSTIINDPGEEDPQDCHLCREAFLFSLKNGVVNICASGNGVLPAVHLSDYYTEGNSFPQNYDDSWVINVGGSGTNGEWFDGTNGTGNETNFFARANTQLDIVAPFTEALIYSTASRLAQDTIHEYASFSGTSGAAPHATGVAALLLSKYNQNCYTNSNLDPADVEYILQKSARDVKTTGFDDFTGYGLLNATKALQMINFPEYQIIHPDLTPTSITETVSDTITLFLNNPLYIDAQGPISSGYPLLNETYYRVVRKEIQTVYDFSSYLQPSTHILDYWTRPSNTNSLQYITDTFMVDDPDLGMITVADSFKIEPHADIVNFDLLGNITLKGYYYHFIGQYSVHDDMYSPVSFGTDYWYPTNPAVQNARMAFSIYLRDSLAPLYIFSCDSLNLPFDSLASVTENISLPDNIILYPNPSNGSLKIATGKGNQLQTLRIISINGVCVKTENILSNVQNNVYEFNFPDLASGLYTLEIVTQDNKRINKKWLKL